MTLQFPRRFDTPAARRAWRVLSRSGPWVLAGVVIALVLRQATAVDWTAVRDAWAALPGRLLAIAALVALAGHAAFAGYDVVARRAIGHAASDLRSLAIGATGYALNLNFGALIGGIAVRLNLYRRAGVPLAQGSRVVASGMAANWSGWLLLLAGVLWWADPLPWPEAWARPSEGLRVAGVVLAATVPGLLWVACAQRDRLPRRARELCPTPWQAAVWLTLAVLSWALATTAVWLLLQDAIPWWSVAGAMLLAAVAGVVTHVPGGLGVLEAVVLATLGGSVPQATLLAALIAYRCVYYGLPLVLALGTYAALASTGPKPGARLRGGTSRARPVPQPDAGGC